MVPDLVLICENMLMAEGFIQGKILASKFYALYSLLRDLLSKQMHYDWGLRAVKSVLVVAGSFKRNDPDMDEEALLMRALRDFNIPKIVREDQVYSPSFPHGIFLTLNLSPLPSLLFPLDQVVFFGLLGDLFPGIDPPRQVDPKLEEYVEKACFSLKKWPDELFRLKVNHLPTPLSLFPSLSP